MSVYYDRKALEEFCSSIFTAAGLSPEDAACSSEIIVEADARGIGSHGVGRMQRYVNGLLSGQMAATATDTVLSETANTVSVDANGGMGFPVSCRTMQTVIDKAEQHGMALGCVRNSNHFGIAGHYAMMALEHDMIGLAMTNTAALGVPTFGRKPMFGTNPVAIAVPAGRKRAFVLDMASTTVTRGKLELYNRLGKELPSGWAVDASGFPAVDAGQLLNDMLTGKGGLLPLGGFGEKFSGHKGYGLAVLVDIFCSLLSGAPFGQDVMDTPTTSARVSHCFGAIRISAFRQPDEFKADMDRMLEALNCTPPSENADHVRYAGEKEFEAEEECMRNGVKVDDKAAENLDLLADKFQIMKIQGRMK